MNLEPRRNYWHKLVAYMSPPLLISIHSLATCRLRESSGTHHLRCSYTRQAAVLGILHLEGFNANLPTLYHILLSCYLSNTISAFTGRISVQ